MSIADLFGRKSSSKIEESQAGLVYSSIKNRRKRVSDYLKPGSSYWQQGINWHRGEVMRERAIIYQEMHHDISDNLRTALQKEMNLWKEVFNALDSEPANQEKARKALLQILSLLENSEAEAEKLFLRERKLKAA